MKTAARLAACSLALVATLAFAGPEGDPPPAVKVDLVRAVTITQDAFKHEPEVFVEGVELVRGTTKAEPRWSWVVELRTKHADHWGPASARIDAQTGEVYDSSNHK